MKGLKRWLSIPSPGYCSRVYRFDSHHMHGRSQPSVTLISKDCMFSSVLCRQQTCKWYTDTQEGKSPYTLNKQINKYIKKMKEFHF